MTAVMQALDRLRRLGVELTPIPPDRIRWRCGGPLPEEARELIEDLRAHKPEALAALIETPPTDYRPWNDTWERARLDAAYNWADGAAREHGQCWAECWAFASQRRPDLVEEMNNALDAIDAAWKAWDVRAHFKACDQLRQSVAAIVANAYDARGSGGPIRRPFRSSPTSRR